MNIAIIGATSQIFNDLFFQWIKNEKKYNVFLYARNIDELDKKYSSVPYLGSIKILDIKEFITTKYSFDAVINFIGGGDPVKIKNFGRDILYSTRYYDDIILSYLEENKKCKYIYISSGAVYGNSFNLDGVDQASPSIHSINDLDTSDFYSVAKFYAEATHRANQEYNIVDIRVFNIFSHTTNINARFFITDVVRAIYDNKELVTSPDDMIRDYIHPSDFFQMIDLFLLYEGHFNVAVDCYSKLFISKFEILDLLSERYMLRWKIDSDLKSLNASGMKVNYYSNNRIASQFGFEPKYSSADIICDSISAILQEKEK